MSLLFERQQPDPNLNHDVEIITIVIIFTVLSLTGLLLRLFSRKMLHAKLSSDDYILIPAFLVCLAQSVMIAYATQYAGLGRHVTTNSAKELVAFTKAFFIVILLWSTTLALSKLSLLILLHRIFITPAFRLTIKILGVIVILWWISTFFASIFICFPVNALWDPSVAGHCPNSRPLNLVAPIPWIVTDFAILLAPIPMVRNLQLLGRQKIGLYALFLLGALTCIVSCVRESTLFYNIDDITWNIVPAAIWETIEANITILCPCLIASRPAIMYLLPDQLISKTRSTLSQLSKFRLHSHSHSHSTNSPNLPQSRGWNPYASLTNLQDQNLELPVYHNMGQKTRMDNYPGSGGLSITKVAASPLNSQGCTS